MHDQTAFSEAALLEAALLEVAELEAELAAVKAQAEENLQKTATFWYCRSPLLAIESK